MELATMVSLLKRKNEEFRHELDFQREITQVLDTKNKPLKQNFTLGLFQELR